MKLLEIVVHSSFRLCTFYRDINNFSSELFFQRYLYISWTWRTEMTSHSRVEVMFLFLFWERWLRLSLNSLCGQGLLRTSWSSCLLCDYRHEPPCLVSGSTGNQIQATSTLPTELHSNISRTNGSTVIIKCSNLLRLNSSPKTMEFTGTAYLGIGEPGFGEQAQKLRTASCH